MVHRVLRYAFVRVTGWIVEHRDLETGASTVYIPGLEPNTAPLAVVSADGRLVYNHAPWGERVMLTTDERGRVASSYAWFAYGGRRVFRRRPHRPRRYRRLKTAPTICCCSEANRASQNWAFTALASGGTLRALGASFPKIPSASSISPSHSAWKGARFDGCR